MNEPARILATISEATPWGEPATCMVSDFDYCRYWQPSVTHPAVPPAWNGAERRTGATDRRLGHDRRWEQARGRRFRLSDRRKG